MQVYEVAVLGKPITQGSMRKSRGGHIVHDKADQLYDWRQSIEDAFYENTGQTEPGFPSTRQYVLRSSSPSPEPAA